MDRRHYDKIDYLKLITALMVVVIHTTPLDMFGDKASFMVHVGISRYAVPLFFAFSSFLLFSRLESTPVADRPKVFARKQEAVISMYLYASLLYLPFDVFELIRRYGSFSIAAGRYLLDFVWYGSHYHLWFFPALFFGEFIAYQFYKRERLKSLLAISVLLFLAGSLGDVYDGLTKSFPSLRTAYLFYFQYVDNIRNALFFALVFITIGLLQARYGSLVKLKTAMLGVGISFGLFVFEIIVAWYLIIARDFNLYLSLVPLTWFLLATAVLSSKAHPSSLAAKARAYSTTIYIVHDLYLMFWTFLLGKGNSMTRFFFVFFLSLFTAMLQEKLKNNHISHHQMKHA